MVPGNRGSGAAVKPKSWLIDKWKNLALGLGRMSGVYGHLL